MPKPRLGVALRGRAAQDEHAVRARRLRHGKREGRGDAGDPRLEEEPREARVAEKARLALDLLPQGEVHRHAVVRRGGGAAPSTSRRRNGKRTRMARKSQRRGPADPSSPDATGAPRDDEGTDDRRSPSRRRRAPTPLVRALPLSSGSLSSAHLPEELRPHLVDRAPRLGRHEQEAPVEALETALGLAHRAQVRGLAPQPADHHPGRPELARPRLLSHLRRELRRVTAAVARDQGRDRLAERVDPVELAQEELARRPRSPTPETESPPVTHSPRPKLARACRGVVKSTTLLSSVTGRASPAKATSPACPISEGKEVGRRADPARAGVDPREIAGDRGAGHARRERIEVEASGLLRTDQEPLAGVGAIPE